MAVRQGTAVAVNLLRGDDGVFAGEVDGFRTHIAEVSIQNLTANTVIGGTDTLDCDLAAAIGNSRRQGGTITIRNAVVSGAARHGSSSFTATSSLSGSTISLTPKASDWSTNATLPAGRAERPYRVLVVYTVS